MIGTREETNRNTKASAQTTIGTVGGQAGSAPKSERECPILLALTDWPQRAAPRELRSIRAGLSISSPELVVVRFGFVLISLNAMLRMLVRFQGFQPGKIVYVDGWLYVHLYDLYDDFGQV